MRQRLVRAWALLLVFAVPAIAGVEDSSPAASSEISAPNPKPDRKCKYRFKQYPMIDQFYPAAARVEDRQGIVYLEFSIPESPGVATDIVVYQSSSHADLDAAGIQALGAATFKTNCTDVRYRAAIKFSLARE